MEFEDNGLHRIDRLALEFCVDWLDWIDRRYAAADVLAGNGPDFSAHSSSLRLTAVTGIDLEEVLRAVGQGGLSRWCERALGARPVCNATHSWVRRQYHPANCPRFHAPHSWHQDGALRFDFLAHAGHPPPREAMLDMVTCWIALTPCGVEAPGLELVTRRLEGLLAPADLADDRVRSRFASMEFCRPVMQPGDALLFRGDILHRTHVTPAMMNDRTSLELRFFPEDNLPPRLRGDQFLPMSCLR